MSKFTKSLIGMMIISLSVVFPAFADENEVVALKSHVNDLNGKISDLQRQVQALASRPAESSGGYVAAPSSGGGLIHTAQDINMSGYANVQFNQNLSAQSLNPSAGATGVGNSYRAFDNNMDTFSLNQFDLAFSKSANPEGGVGFMLDLLVGQDARVINAGTTGHTADYITPVQAYIDVVAPLNFVGDNNVLGKTVDFQVGRFVTLAGAEVIRAPDNWNISRSLIFTLGEPLTHTGIRSTYKLFNDKLTTYLGVNNGWDNEIDNNQWKTIETGFSISPIDKVTWITSLYIGPENNQTSGHKRYLLSNVLGWDATDKLSFKTEFTLGSESRVNNLLDPTGSAVTGAGNGVSWQNAQWWGWAGYVRYQLTERWGWVYRLELFRDADQFRTALLGNGASAINGINGASRSTWEMTFGTDYKIYDNLTGRLEYRFDKSNTEDPFNADSHQSTIGAELIYAFA